MAGNTKNIFVRIALKDAMSAQMKTVNNSLKATARSANEVNAGISSMNKHMGMLAGTVGSATLAFAGFYAGFQQLKTGLQFVEDFKLSVASMTGFMVTFSQKTKDGDIAGAFKDANAYAEKLIPQLEIMDSRTVATGRELKLIVETMMQYGTVIDVSNKKQREGLIALSNAVKLVTKGQNQEIQMRQEIRALMTGQLRMTDQLPILLNRIHQQIGDTSLSLKDQINIWRQQGTLLENIRRYLEGFNVVIPKIQETWTAVGTTMQTIYQVILREGMKPMYQDLIDLSKEFNTSLRDQGEMTALSLEIEDKIAAGWQHIKEIAEGVKLTFESYATPLGVTSSLIGKVAGEFLKIITDAKKLAFILTSLINYAALKGMAAIFAGISAAVFRAVRSFTALDAAAMSSTRTIRVMGMTMAASSAEVGILARSVGALKVATRGLLAAFGGPAGLAFAVGFAVTELWSWHNISEKAKESTDALALSFDEYKKSLEGASQAQLRLNMYKMVEQINNSAGALENAKSKLQAFIQTANAYSTIGGKLPLSQVDPALYERQKTELQAQVDILQSAHEELIQRYQALSEAGIQGAANVPKLINQQYTAILSADSKFQERLAALHEKYSLSEIEKINLKYDKEKDALKAAYEEKEQLLKSYTGKDLNVIEMMNKDAAALQEEYDAIERARIKDLSEYRSKKYKESVDDLKKQNKEIYASLKGLTDPLENFYTVSDKTLSKVEKRFGGFADDVCDFNKVILNCTDKAYQKLGMMSKHVYEQKKANAKKAYDAIVKNNGDVVKAQEGYSEELKKIDEDYNEGRTSSFSSGTKSIIKLQSELVNDMGRIFDDYISKILHGEIDTIGDMFKGLFDSILEMFLRMVAQMAANSLIEVIFGNGASGGPTLGAAISSLFGGSGGGGDDGSTNITSMIPSSGMGSTVHDWIATNVSEGVADGLSTVASGAAVVGGAYGMYSGINNMAHGNVGTGAVQTGVGAYSTYQGAVGLGWIEEGTATELASDVAGYLGYTGGQTTVAPYVSGQVYQQLGSEVGTEIGQAAGEEIASQMATEATVDYSVDAAGGYAAESAGLGAETYSAGWAALPLILGSIWMGIENAGDKQFGEQNYMMTNAELQGNMSFDSHEAEQKYLDQTLQDIFKNSFDSLTMELGSSFDDLANFAATHLDTSGIEHFVEAFGDIDISAEQSAQVLALATEAAHGNAAAYQDLQATMVGFGLDAEQSSQATETLMEAMRRAGEVSDITLGQMLNREAEDITLAGLEGALTQAMTVNGESVQELINGYDGSSESLEYLIGELTSYEEGVHSNAEMLQLATSAAGGNTSAIESLVAAFEDYGQSTGQAKGSTEAMIQAVQHLSNTNLDLEATARLNVEVVGAANAQSSVSTSAGISSSAFAGGLPINYRDYDPYDPWGDAEGSALGGIFMRPAFFANGRFAGEAGPEAILPLPYGPQMMKDIYDATVKNAENKSQPTVIHLQVNVAGRAVDDVIIPVVDRHIVNRERAGVNGRVIYAAG